MQKPLFPWWRLQAIVNAEVQRIAPNSRIIASVQHIDDAIAWDDECEGLGRVPWFCDYIVLSDDPASRAIIPTLNAAMAHWQSHYDLGVTCE